MSILSAKPLAVFYSFRRCPYAMRARLALLVSGVQVELREVVLRQKPEEFLAASPSATVPTLDLARQPAIDESLDIMFWALAQNDPEDWLQANRSPNDRDTLIAQADGEFKSHLDRYKYASRHPEGEGEYHRTQASNFLNLLDGKLQQSRYLTGDKLSIADMAIAPFVRQFANTDRAWFGAQPWQALISWLEKFTGSVDFQLIMHKYSQWQPGDTVTAFPPM